jgi:hypothetical protein
MYVKTVFGLFCQWLFVSEQTLFIWWHSITNHGVPERLVHCGLGYTACCLLQLTCVHTATFKVVKQVVTGAAMERRAGHIAAIVRNQLVVYGGIGARSQGLFPDIYFTDISKP